MSLTSVDLPGTGDAGDRGEHAEREGHVDLAQVVLAGADHRELLAAVDRPPDGGHLDALLAGKIGAGKGIRVAQQLVVGAAVHDPAAVLAGRRADVDHPVGMRDGVQVVLDDDQRVAQIPQPDQGFDQPAVVALMQADRRLVEHVQHPDQARADLGGQPNALRLTAGQRRRRPRQRQVLEPDVEQEAEPRLDLLEHLPGDRLLARPERQIVEEVRAVGDRQLGDLGDGLRAALPRGQCHRQDLRLQPGAVAHRARHVAHEALVAFLHLLGVGLLHAALQERHHAFEVGVVGPGAAVAVPVPDVHLLVAALENRLARLGRQLAPRRVDVEAQRVAQPGQHPGEVLGGLAHRPRRHRALGQRQIRVGDDEVGVDLLADAQAGALGAGAVGRVERERPRLQVVDGQRVAVGAGQLLGEPLLAVRRIVVVVDELQHHDAVGQAQRGLHRVGQPLLGGGLDRQPVDDHLDVVLLLLLQLRRVGQRMHHAVDPDPAVALRVQLVEQVDELALAGAHHRGEHLEPGALVHGEHLVDDLLRRLPGDPLTADRAVRGARPRVQQAQVVVDLGDGADGRSRVAVGGLLVDGHRRRQTLDEVDVRLVHLTEELPRVRRQRLDVAALALGEDRVERQRRLARTGQPGEHDQGIARQVKVDASQVVLAGTLDDQAVSHSIPSRSHTLSVPADKPSARPCYVPPTDKPAAEPACSVSNVTT